MTPPRHPTRPAMPVSPMGRTEGLRPEGTGRFRIPTEFDNMEPTPVEAMLEMTQPVFLSKQTTVPSKAFIAAIAAILGVILSTGTIIGILGKAFYVQRDEYTQKNLRDAETTTIMQQTLTRLGTTLDRQAAAFDRVSEAVQTIKVDMARGWRGWHSG